MNEQVKLKSVLNNILNRNFQITYEQKTAILENVKNEASTEGKPTTNARIYINWMECAFHRWQSEGPTIDILIFFIDVLNELSKNKNIFVLLHQDDIIKRMIHIIEYVDFTQDCEIIQKFIKLLDSFTHTDFGRHWIVSSLDCWKHVFKVIPSRRYTEDLSVFLKNLFLNVVDSSEIFSMDISKLILQPLKAVCYKVSENDIEEFVEEDLCEILPTINLLSSVVMRISESVTLESQWLNQCNNLLDLQKPLKILLDVVKGEEITLELSKLLTALSFLELNEYSKESHKFIDLFSTNILKILDLNTDRQFIDNITVLSYNMQHFWFHIRRLIDIEQLKLPYDLGVTLCLYQTTTFFGISMKILGNKLIDTLEEDDLRDDFVRDFMKKVNMPLMKNIFKLKESLFEINSFILEAHLAMNFVLKTLDLYNKDSQIMVFNVMLYIIGDIIVDIVDRGGITSEHYDAILVTDFIKTFVVFADKCDITWRDVTLHMTVMDTVTDLLQVQDLPFDVIIAALKLLDLSINKEMAPNLILLMDSNSEMSIGPVGELLLKHLNSENVEVRCAASKVLLTISESAKTKYPFFQNLILEFNVCQLLMERIFSSEVVKVRVDALKCLQHLVKIDAIWNVFCTIPDILVTLINSLKTETENLLRAEMVNLVAAIYEQDHFTDLQIKDLYEIMKCLGIHDFDVTVRINTLKFWDIVIKKFLIDEGMIDNEFPKFTFSRKSKKIVILDEVEIQRRLRRFIMNLSEIGCLTVLNACFTSKEKSEKQCVDEIVSDLITLLEKYKVDLSSKMNCRRNILESLEPEVLSPADFLQNITEQQDKNLNEDVSVNNFTLILDEILSQNNLDDLYSIDTYLRFNK